MEGVGTHELTIEGVSELGGCTHRIGPDHIEIGSMIGLAAITGSAITIQDVEPELVDPLRVGFGRLGIQFDLRDGDLRLPAEQLLEIQSDYGDQIPSLGDGPWPAFPADLTSIALVVASEQFHHPRWQLPRVLAVRRVREGAEGGGGRLVSPPVKAA